MKLNSFFTVLLLLVCVGMSAYSQIHPGKSVKISILGVPSEEKGRIDGDYPVAENGTINMPFIGHVRAVGMKPENLASALEARYRGAKIYRNPTFQVVSDIEGGAPDAPVVHIGGQVGRSGPVPYLRGLTLWQAIQAAGGPTPFGTMKRVSLMRAGKVRTYDVTQIQFMQIPLEPKDSITIPQKRPWETR